MFVLAVEEEDVWPFSNLFDNVGTFLIRGWVSVESQRLAQAVRDKAARQ